MKIKKEDPNFNKAIRTLTANAPFVLDKKKCIFLIVLIAGLKCIALSVISMVGWYTHTKFLFQVSMKSTPIQYNAALGFGVLGIGLMLLLTPYKKWAAIFGITLGIYGGLVIIEYLFNVSVGIDELFFKSYILTGTSSPGRMSPNSAIAFMACGISLFLLSFQSLSRMNYFFVLVLGMCILALGSISLLGYAANLPDDYRWAKLTPMAVQTSICFIVVSVGLIAYVYGKHISGAVNLSAVAPYVASTFVIFLTSLLWAASLQREVDGIRNLISLEAEDFQEKITSKIQENVSNLEELGFLKIMSPSLPDAIWLTSEAFYQKKIPWYKTVLWIDPAFQVRQVIPPQGNEKLLNLNLHQNFLLEETLEAARKERNLKFSKTTNFNSLGVGFFIVDPLFEDLNFKGFLTVFIDINKMLKDIVKDSQSSKLRFALFEGKAQEKSFFTTSKNEIGDLFSQKDIDLYNLHWVIKIWPSPEYIQEHTQLLSKVIFLIGILIAFLVFSTIRSRQIAKTQELILHKTQKNLEGKFSELNRHSQELQYIKDLTQDLQTCSSLKMAAIPIAKYCELLFPSACGVVYLANTSTRRLRPFARWGQRAIKPVTFPASKCNVFQKGNPSHISGFGYDEPCDHLKKSIPDGSSSLNLCLPLTDKDGVLGLLQISDYPRSEKKQKNPFLLPETLAIQLSLSISNIKKGDLLKDQAIRDPLTNLYNRRFLDETLRREFYLAERQSLPLSIIMLDIDFFKHINDKYGHEAGDDVLKHIALLLQERFRKSDIPCRFGGEEFILVLPGTPLNIALEKSEQLRRAVQDLRLSFQGDIIRELTISLGVATYPKHGKTIIELKVAVDKALYKAKKLGRNRVEIARGGSKPIKKKKV